MSIQLNDNIDVKAPKPTDARYGPWASEAAAKAGVTLANRYVGLTVAVLVAGVATEYWWNDGTADGDLVLKTVDTSGEYLPLAGGTMSGAINWTEAGQTATIDIITDPLSSTGEVMTIGSNAGVNLNGPYVVLDTTNLQITMPGAVPNAAITVAGVDANGVVSLGYSLLPEPAYSVSDTTAAAVIIKAAGNPVPSPWISLGLGVSLTQDLPVGTANVMFEGIFRNNTSLAGVAEFGLRVNGGTVNARDVVIQISPQFNQTIAMQLPLQTAYFTGDTLELMGRVTAQSGALFEFVMANTGTDLGTLKIYTVASTGTAGAVTSVGAVAPVASSGGSAPQISMAAATNSADGYLSAANFNTFNGKANASGSNATGTWPISITGAAGSASTVVWTGVTSTPTTIAGYGITDAYTKAQVDTALAGKANTATTLAGYGITNAYTKTESDALYPTKAGTGATGTWAISISGNAATASSTELATTALGVDDLNSTSVIKQWVGLQAEYDALGSWDASTFYNITDAETPSEPGGGGASSWDDITGKPATYPPSAHTHAIADVTNLQATLNAKADDATTLAGYGITDAYTKTESDSTFAATVHTHTIANVTGLQAALDAKADDATTLAGYGITNAYTKTESDANYPTKVGGGASGTWAISISGAAGSASSVAWTGVTSTPTTIAGYGILDAYTKTQSDANYPTKTGVGATGTWGINISGNAATVSSVSWANISGTPTTLSGYSISDAYTKTESDTRYVNVTGDTMTGALNWNENGQLAVLDIVADPLSSTGDVFDVSSDAGVQVRGPYVVLDTTNLQITMPGAQQNAALTVAAIDAFGVVSLGYTVLPPPSYSVSDTTTTPVVIKAAGAVPPGPWVTLGLDVTLAQDIPSGTGNIQFEGVFVNSTVRSGTVEFGLQINGGAINSRDIKTQISPNFNQTIAMALPLQSAYVDGDVLSLVARVTDNDNNQFSLEMANTATDIGAMRIYTIPSSGTSGGGTVESVGGVAPVVSSGGINPQISMAAATSSANGYLSAANFNTFNNKADTATTLAGYGITNAYTKTESDANYPSTSGVGATGTWSISIYGNSATASAVAWAGVSSKPTTIAGYGITDAYTKTETNSLLSGKADDATTLAGYGITDAYTKVQADAQFQEPATTLAGYGITDAYTKTQSDANYPTKAGAGASGTWGISISGNAGYASTSDYANSVADVNNPATDVKQWIGTQAQYDALGSWDAGTFYNITDAETPSEPGGGGTVAWDDVTGKPSTFPPSTHSHTISEVTNLQTTLDGKAATVHAHAIADITGLQTALDGKASTTHTHTTAQVTGLDAALAAKAPIADPLFTGNARAPTAAVNTNTTAIATTAFVVAQIADDAPTKTGGGATGTWPIGISGTAALATAVNDNGTNPSMKFWYGTESEFTAIVTKDPSTIYFRSA